MLTSCALSLVERTFLSREFGPNMVEKRLTTSCAAREDFDLRQFTTGHLSCETVRMSVFYNGSLLKRSRTRTDTV